MNHSASSRSLSATRYALAAAALLMGTLIVGVGTAHAQGNADPLAHACGVTMNFAPGTVQYSDCIHSLQSAQAAARQDAATRQHSSSCIAQGLKPGTSSYASCMLTNDHAS